MHVSCEYGEVRHARSLETFLSLHDLPRYIDVSASVSCTPATTPNSLRVLRVSEIWIACSLGQARAGWPSALVASRH